MKILLIDTCTERGLIACSDSKEILFERDLPFGTLQSKFLMPYIQEMFQRFPSFSSLDLIGVGMGPGSYTGIRIGVSVAHTLAYAWKVPLVGVSSLEGFVPSVPDVSYAALVDARIGGVYCQRKGERAPQVIPLSSIIGHLEGVTHLITPNAKTLKTKLLSDQEWVWEEKGPSAAALLQSVKRSFAQEQVVIPPRHLNLLYLRETEAERNNKSSR